jgi:hypothetical protein
VAGRSAKAGRIAVLVLKRAQVVVDVLAVSVAVVIADLGPVEIVAKVADVRADTAVAIAVLVPLSR